MTAAEIVAIAVSAVGAIISSAAVYEAYRMRKNIKEFADAQLKLGQASSISADRSAKAAEETVKTAIQGMQISQRAYLGTTGIEFLSHLPTVNEALVVKVTLKNVGHSPALDVRMRYKIDFLTDVRTVPLVYSDSKEPGFDIAPGVEVPLEHALPGTVTSDQKNALDNDSKRLYAFGWARYKDIFGKQYNSRWCYEYTRFTPGEIFTLTPGWHKLEELDEGPPDQLS